MCVPKPLDTALATGPVWLRVAVTNAVSGVVDVVRELGICVMYSFCGTLNVPPSLVCYMYWNSRSIPNIPRCLYIPPGAMDQPGSCYMYTNRAGVCTMAVSLLSDHWEMQGHQLTRLALY